MKVLEELIPKGLQEGFIKEEVMELKAYAKINLGLKILDKTSDGYHLLDMVMLPISLCDNIKITKRNDNISTVKVINNFILPPFTQTDYITRHIEKLTKI